MGARARVALRRVGRASVLSPALFNGGFESDRPSALLPLRAAIRLFPRFPEGTVAEDVDLAVGRDTVRTAAEPIEARVLTRDRRGPAARLDAVISADSTEILLSDSAIEALGVEVIKPAQGLWRFVGEKRLRKSVRPRYW